MGEASPTRLISILGKIPLFSGLDQGELKVVLAMCKALLAYPDEVIFQEGDPSHDMFVVLSGHIELSTRDSGRIYRLGSCDIFGEIGLITQRTRSASATALDECRLLAIHHQEFNLLAGKNPRISAILHRNISANLADHVTRMNHTPLEHIPQQQASPTANESQVLKPHR